MKEITIKYDGQEIKAQISDEELEKLMQEPEWPQLMDKYWCVDYLCGMINIFYWDGDLFDRRQQSIGNVYRTQKAAEGAFRAQKLIAAVAKRRKELNGDWKQDWFADSGCEKYYIRYRNNELSPVGTSQECRDSIFGAFKSVRAVQTIIDEFEDELTWYFAEYLPSIN